MSNDMPSDIELVHAIQNGDPRAFDTLYFRYRDFVTRLAMRFTNDANESLDILQETFLYLIKRLPGLELQGRLGSLLYPTVKHIALNHLLKRRRMIGGAEQLEVLYSSQVGPISDIATVIKNLPIGQQEVVLLRFVDDLNLDEIAVALSIPLGTVKSRLHHALGQLRNDPRVKKYFFE